MKSCQIRAGVECGAARKKAKDVRRFLYFPVNSGRDGAYGAV
jgi:hypothetical protein